MEIKNQFTQDEMIRFFRENGITVTENRIKKYLGNESWTIWEWQILNPNSGKYENMENTFRDIMEKRSNNLLLSGFNRIDLLNQLKK